VDTTGVGGVYRCVIGSSSSVAIPGVDEFMHGEVSTETTGNWGGGRYAYVPASTTLHLRAQGSGTGESQDYCIYGVY